MPASVGQRSKEDPGPLKLNASAETTDPQVQAGETPPADTELENINGNRAPRSLWKESSQRAKARLIWLKGHLLKSHSPKEDNNKAVNKIPEQRALREKKHQEQGIDRSSSS